MPSSLDNLVIVVNDDVDGQYWRFFVKEAWNNVGWTFQETDIDVFKAAFKLWHYVALEKTTKKPVSTVFLALYEASPGKEPLYSIGFYYTTPEWRGTGIGTKLFSDAMKIAGDNNVTLNGVPNMSMKYASRFGFDKLLPFVHNYGTVQLKDVTPPIEQDDYTAKKVSEVPWGDIVEYDMSVCTRKREKFLKQYIAPKENTFTRIVLNSNNKIVGLACIRIVYGNELVAGPVYADNKEACRLALDCILSDDIDKTKHQRIFFLYPNVNIMAERILQELSGGHVKIEPFTQSQFTKNVIETPHSKVFSISDYAANFV